MNDAPDQQRARRATRMEAAEVYETVRMEGEEELGRPVASLWWSGVAAGLVMGISLIGEALLHAGLPNTPWRGTVTAFGYGFGFVIVVLGRLQLFTENTITPVLPLLADFRGRTLWLTARLWAVVLAANVTGALLAAAYVAFGGLGDGDALSAALEVARSAVNKPAPAVVASGVAAGFLVAALVWLLPSAGDADVWVIVAITYLIGLGDFTHVVVGSVEAWLLLLTGGVGPSGFFLFLGAALLGNILGGTVLFSLLAYGQVHEEIE